MQPHRCSHRQSRVSARLQANLVGFRFAQAYRRLAVTSRLYSVVWKIAHPSSLHFEKYMYQFTSQVFPLSAEKDCCHVGRSGFVLSQRNSTSTGIPLCWSCPRNSPTEPEKEPSTGGKRVAPLVSIQ